MGIDLAWDPDSYLEGAAVFTSGDPRPCSVSAWGYVPAARSPNALAAVFANSSDATPCILVGFGPVAPGPVTKMRLLASSGVWENGDEITFVYDVWGHFAWLWADDDSYQFYYNGVDAGSGTYANDGLGSFDAAQIGSADSGAVQKSDGLADFAAWSRLLTEAEVLRLAAGDAPGNIATPISWVPMKGLDGADYGSGRSAWSFPENTPTAMHHPPALIKRPAYRRWQ